MTFYAPMKIILKYSQKLTVRHILVLEICTFEPESCVVSGTTCPFSVTSVRKTLHAQWTP